MTARIGEDRLQELARAFRREMDGAGRRGVAQLEQELVKLRREMDRKRADLLSMQGRQRDLADELALRQSRDQQADDEAKMFAAIAALEEVDRVEMSKFGVEVYTHEIVTGELKDGTRRRLGKFRITLGFDGQVHVACLNKDEVKDPKKVDDYFYAYEHPHVFPSERYGYPNENVCWGNVGQPVREFMEAGQFDGATALALQFLNRYTEDKGYSIESWRVYVPPEEQARVVEALPGATAREDPVYDRQGRLLGYRVTPLMGEHAQPRALPTRFRWQRVACQNKESVNVDERTRTGDCPVCGAKDVPVGIVGRLQAHGVRAPVEEPVEGGRG